MNANLKENKRKHLTLAYRMYLIYYKKDFLATIDTRTLIHHFVTEDFVRIERAAQQESNQP